MGFRLNGERVVWWPVTINVPIDDGKVDPQKARLRLKLVDTDQFGGGKSALIRDHVLDWDGFEDESGSALPFNTENLERVLNKPYASEAIGLALFEASRGAPAKN